jgi:ligand-binding sensor domain-containing protein
MKKLRAFLFAFLCFGAALHAQWVERNNGLYGGIVNTLATNGSSLFAGTSGGGVFLSANNGATWTATNNGLNNFNIYSLAISSSNIFVGTASGMYLSTNNGMSWTPTNVGLTNSVKSLVTSGSNVYAGGGSGVYFSTNNGTSWTEVNAGLTEKDVRALAINGNNIFAGTYNGIFLSTNNGTSWTAVNNGLTSGNVQSLAVSGTNIFAGTTDGLFLSTNNGASWTPVNTGLTTKYVMSLAVNGSNIYAGTNGGGVFLSTNNGTSWTSSNSGMPNVNVVPSLLANGSDLFGGTINGIYYSSNNGTSWAAVSTGLTSAYASAILTNANNTFAATYNGLYRSVDNGATWTAVNTGLTTPYITSLAAIGSNLFAGTAAGGGVFISTDNGTSWTAVNTGLTTKSVTCLTVNGSNIFAGTSNGVFLSSNNGASWTEVSAGITTKYINCLTFSGSNLFAGIRDGGIYLSTNNGTSWSAVNTGFGSNNTWIGSIVVSGSNVFAGTWDGGVYLSTNNGGAWAATTNIGGSSANSTRYLAIGGGKLFVGTINGVFLSTNNGASWGDGSTGLNRGKFILALSTDANNIFAGTSGSGVWSRSLAEFGSSIPTITSFTPTSGSAGSSVTISGTNFDPTPANNTVKFNGTIATVTSSTAISITANVPISAATGKITVIVGGVTATSQNDFTISGSSTQPEINVRQGLTNIATAGFYDFGSQSISVAGSAVTFTIENTGTGVLSVSGAPKVAITGSNASDFSVNQTATTATVAPAGTTTFSITFSPTVAGAKTAQLSIANDDANENPYVINLTGTGSSISTTPEINIKQGTTNIASAATFDFGNQVTTVAATPLTFTIENTGTGALNLTGNPKVAISGTNSSDYIVTQSATAATVAAGATTSFIVSFSPASPAGTKTAQLSIANNDSNENPYIINLTGVALTCTNPAKPTITQTSNSDFTSSTLTSSAAPTGGTYQWFNNSTAIPSATSQSFITSAIGSYTVRVTVSGGCSALSDPFVIIVTGTEPAIVNELSAYPNPVKDWLTLSLGKFEGKKDITIYQTSGKQMTAQETQGKEASIYVADYPAGMYFVKVATTNSVGVVKFIKQ